MIEGKQRKTITVQDIMSATNGGHDIFRYYLGKVERCMDRPWGKKEKKSSWGIFPHRDGIWYWKDQATEECGNAIQFLQRYQSLTFPEAMDKIAFDFGLGGKFINVKPVVVTWEVPTMEDYCDINFFTKPFTPKHHAFWNIAEVMEEDCRGMNCFAVKDLAINRKRVPIGKDEIVFAYYCPEEDGAKIYFPERQKSEKFRNNVSFHHLWNFSNLQNCEDLIVQKSPKDMIVTSMLTKCVTATQAEAVKIFDKGTVDKINSVSKRPWIWYGSDWDGVKKCKEITDTNKWRYINTPKALLPEINDTYGYASIYKLKGLEEFMKLKKLL